MDKKEYQYIEYQFGDEVYCFEASIIDAMFLKKFATSAKLQINYQILQTSFSKEKCKYFAIYDREILDDRFIDAFLRSEEVITVSSATGQKHLDPATTPVFSKNTMSATDVCNIQKALVAIYQKYGKKGLRNARKCHLAQTLIGTTHSILVEDLEDKYDLPLNEEDQTKKVIKLVENTTLNKSLDVIGSINFLYNENIISAISSIPSLLYDEKGNYYGDSYFCSLIIEVNKRLNKKLPKRLDAKALEEATTICKQIYLERHLPKYLKK